MENPRSKHFKQTIEKYKAALLYVNVILLSLIEAVCRSLQYNIDLYNFVIAVCGYLCKVIKTWLC